MYSYRKINNLLGWIVFAISAAVYLMTIEPTASFWDCGEFILSSYKLEVGHPPGAPLFLILGRIFTLFASPENAAVCVNSMSALASAFTILFLFWTITHLGRKLVADAESMTAIQKFTIFSSGVIGSLAYTFSDTFWFSAVEGEVYGTSSLLTAIVFWAILKWEDCSDEKFANRWLVLIAYIMGLSIGVHLLNLLTIPAIGLIYHFRKNPQTTRKKTFKAFLLSCIVLGVITWGIIPGTFLMAAKFELLFVNGFHLPYNTGAYFWFILLIGAVVSGIWYTYRIRKSPLWNTVLLCVATILLGYSSYAMIVIRSSANTPMDQNNPNDPFSILYYLNREQYGDRPLLYGPYYNAPVLDAKDGKKVYARRNNRYEVVSTESEYVYDSRFMTLFPRMYDSRETSHISQYEIWGDVNKTRRGILSTNAEGEQVYVNKPSFGENLRFFFRYQLDFMYFRYFMWNFSGRQNDFQASGSPLEGNWITGINFLDEFRLGPQHNLPERLRDNEGRNRYYMLPFLLGVIGLLFQYGRSRKDFLTVLMLFFMTGIAIVLYLNQTPLQPRERDYAYAGSFYAFSIWIGLGVMALIEAIPERFRRYLSAVVAPLLFMAVPVLMAEENWDDHDRSGRYIARDIGYDYLQTCEPNAIIFTNGDNDTFPLWYNQEAEGVRTDVRVVNLSYLSADWYIDQMHRKAYLSEPLSSSMTNDQYQTGSRDVLYVVDRMENPQDLRQIVEFIASDDERTKTIPGSSEPLTYSPTRKFKLPVDRNEILDKKVVPEEDSALVVQEMNWSIPNKSLYQDLALFKNGLMELDIFANNLWERPIYFAVTVDNASFLGMDKYFRLDGFAYRIVPVEGTYSKTSGDNFSVNTDILYHNLMEKYRWGNIEDKNVYFDEQIRRMMGNYRSLFLHLAEALNNEGDHERAVEVMDKALTMIDNHRSGFSYNVLPFVDQYMAAGAVDKAKALMDQLFGITAEDLIYYMSFSDSLIESLESELRVSVYILDNLDQMGRKYDYQELSDKVNSLLDALSERAS